MMIDEDLVHEIENDEVQIQTPGRCSGVVPGKGDGDTIQCNKRIFCCKPECARYMEVTRSNAKG